MFADMADRIAALHPGDHAGETEGCAICSLLGESLGLPGWREQEIRTWIRIGLDTRGHLAALLEALAAERARVGEAEQERDEWKKMIGGGWREGLLARAEKAEKEHGETKARAVVHLRAFMRRAWAAEARVACLEQALKTTGYCPHCMGHVQPSRDFRWCVEALAGPGDPEEPLCPVCQGPTRPTGPGSFRCVGGCYWPDGEETT